jgi:uncharacterized protein (DUF2141 family)
MMLLAMALAAEAVAPITIEVRNVRNARGDVRVDICPKDRFLADGCPWHAAVPARAGMTVITVAGVPPGDYAAQAFHDENDNDKIDRGWFGIPKEGIGFSRDAHFVPSSPKWRDAEFTHTTAAQTIHFSLRYLTGPANAEEWHSLHLKR